MARKKVVRIRKDVPSSWEEALQQYLWFKQAEGLRDITLKGHRDVIRLLFKSHPEAYDADKVKYAVYAFMGEKIKPATYNIRRNYLKQLWPILSPLDFTATQNIFKIRKTKTARRKPRFSFIRKEVRRCPL